MAAELAHLLSPYVDIGMVYFDAKKGYLWHNSHQISFRDVFRSIPALSCDVLHTHTLRPDVFSAIRKIFLPKIKTVTTLHNYFYEEYRLEYPLIPGTIGIIAHHLSLKNKNALVAITPHMKWFYESKGFREVTYIPNTRIITDASSENQKLIRQLTTWADGHTMLMTIGTVNERKNLHTILPLLKLHDEYRWVHVGDGPLMKALRESVDELNLTHRVYFTGYVPEGNQLLQAADLLLLPSLSEGFPLVVLEAFQRRVPVVANTIPAFEGLFTDEILQCVVENATDFAETVACALACRGDITSRAIQRFEAEFSPQAVANAYLRLYESIL